jgi:hypothetical protein
MIKNSAYLSILPGIITGICLLLSGCHFGENKEQVSLNIGGMLQPVPAYSVMSSEDYWIWGGSMVRTDDGICHLFYSRWSKEYEFKDWISKSEIAYATATEPGGPYTFKKVIHSGRGEDHWDSNIAHNPHIKRFGDRYYLYYVSQNSRELGLGERENQIFSQRIGIAVADSPSGSWTMYDQPLVDLQEGKAAHGYVTNPSVCQRPDGSYLMIMKSRPENWRDSKKFIAVQCLATSSSPDGPFTILEEPVLAEFTVEDPYLWIDNGQYYVIADDQYGNYVESRGLILFESPDGIHWELSENPLVSNVEIRWEDQSVTKLRHLERPQLWYNKKGKPAVLFLAAQQEVQDESGNMQLNSFNVHIPLK